MLRGVPALCLSCIFICWVLAREKTSFREIRLTARVAAAAIHQTSSTLWVARMMRVRGGEGGGASWQVSPLISAVLKKRDGGGSLWRDVSFPAVFHRHVTTACSSPSAMTKGNTLTMAQLCWPTFFFSCCTSSGHWKKKKNPNVARNWGLIFIGTGSEWSVAGSCPGIEKRKHQSTSNSFTLFFFSYLC